MLGNLTDEHEAFRAAVRTFVEREVKPHVAQWEAEGALPRPLFTKLGASGIIRVAEAALQVQGKAGARQVDGVRMALATGYGVYAWSDVIVLGDRP